MTFRVNCTFGVFGYDTKRIMVCFSRFGLTPIELKSIVLFSELAFTGVDTFLPIYVGVVRL